MLGNLGFPEILIIMVIVLLLFGAKRIPEIAGSMGKGIKEFKKNIKDEDEEAPVKKDAPVTQTETVTRTVEAPVASTTPVSATPVETNGRAVQALKCPHCDALNPINAKLCNQCGTSLAAPVS